MTRLAKAGCAEHHVAVLERLVNSFPPEWLLPPQSGEIFENLEHCNRRLRAFALVTTLVGASEVISPIDIS